MQINALMIPYQLDIIDIEQIFSLIFIEYAVFIFIIDFQFDSEIFHHQSTLSYRLSCKFESQKFMVHENQSYFWNLEIKFVKDLHCL